MRCESPVIQVESESIPSENYKSEKNLSSIILEDMLGILFVRKIVICLDLECLFYVMFFSLISCENKAGYNQEIPNDSLGVSEAFSILGLKFHQSMIFYGKHALFITPEQQKLICDVYDLNTKEWLTNIELPHDGYKCPHANVSCLGNQFHAENSAFPLLYVSAWNGGRQCFVYDITSKENTYLGKVVQVIDPNQVSKEIIGNGYLDWVVDNADGFIYTLAYHLEATSQKSAGNYTHITKFKIPHTKDEKVILEDKDVIENFIVPVMTVFQDKDFYNGHIYVVAGKPSSKNMYPPRLFDIDVNMKKLSQYKIPLVGEPEGFVVYKGKKFLNIGSTEKIYNKLKLWL